MSASLIRRGLELLEGDIKDVSKTKKKKQQQCGAASGMEQLSTNRQGVTKQVRRLQGRRGSKKSKATVKDKRIRSAVEEFRKKQGTDHLQNNLKYFMKDKIRALKSDTMKILNHHPGRQARNRPIQGKKKEKAESSVFTEEEFQQFQKDYFGRVVETQSQ